MTNAGKERDALEKYQSTNLDRFWETRQSHSQRRRPRNHILGQDCNIVNVNEAAYLFCRSEGTGKSPERTENVRLSHPRTGVPVQTWMDYHDRGPHTPSHTSKQSIGSAWTYEPTEYTTLKWRLFWHVKWRFRSVPHVTQSTSVSFENLWTI